tara:strand:+ start:778 stop:1056 length:279 start_codon:yes stop_codon:yes gene_type:complete
MMVKIILESKDFEKMVSEKYPGSKIAKGLPSDLEVFIIMDEVKMSASAVMRETVVDKDGNIDANKSGLVLENRKKTKPGSAMGRSRGRMPVF